MAQVKSPQIAEFVVISVVLSICENIWGFGPSLFSAIAYIPRVEPTISPFNVPRQDITTHILRSMPPIPPKMFLNAVVAPSVISTSFVAPPATPI